MSIKNCNTDIAFEVLMQENNPNSRKYDSGYDGILPECRECRFHRPLWKYETCLFKYCPYSLKQISTRKKRKEE